VDAAIAAFEINGHIYLLCIDVIQYDGKWFLTTDISLTVAMAIMPGLYGLVPLSSPMGINTGFNEALFREMLAAQQ
jgi:hypothetical protein